MKDLLLPGFVPIQTFEWEPDRYYIGLRHPGRVEFETLEDPFDLENVFPYIRYAFYIKAPHLLIGVLPHPLYPSTISRDIREYYTEDELRGIVETHPYFQYTRLVSTAIKKLRGMDPSFNLINLICEIIP
jgi:hypothetical protein